MMMNHNVSSFSPTAVRAGNLRIRLHGKPTYICLYIQAGIATLTSVNNEGAIVSV
jgi:hypothetical protein